MAQLAMYFMTLQIPDDGKRVLNRNKTNNYVHSLYIYWYLFFLYSTYFIVFN